MYHRGTRMKGRNISWFGEWLFLYVMEEEILFLKQSKVHHCGCAVWWMSSGRAYLSGLWCWVHLWRLWGGKHNRGGLPRRERGLQQTESDVKSRKGIGSEMCTWIQVAIDGHIILFSPQKSTCISQYYFKEWMSLQKCVLWNVHWNWLRKWNCRTQLSSLITESERRPKIKQKPIKSRTKPGQHLFQKIKLTMLQRYDVKHFIHKYELKCLQNQTNHPRKTKMQLNIK